MRRYFTAGVIAGVGMLALLARGPSVGVHAQSFPDPNAGKPPEVFGKVSPLIPMQSVEAVHMGLVWKRNSEKPKILYHARFPEYRVNDMADSEVTDLAIARGALTNSELIRDPVTGAVVGSVARNNFNTSLRDAIHGFDTPGPAPFLGLRPTDCVAGDPRASCQPDDSFQRLTYGGYTMRQGLSQSVPTRIRANRTMERQLLFDPFHPDAFKNFTTNPKFHTSLLDEADFAANRAAFAENGYSKGMFYNTYCNARVTLADGKVYVFGGHDMQSDNGIYKVNVFDPETEEWVRRTEPCTLANWRKDPYGKELFARDPNAQFYPGCDPRDQQSTQPSDPSDQKYARWYPSAAPLPNGWILVIGGFDQDSTVLPDPPPDVDADPNRPPEGGDGNPDRFAKGRLNQTQQDRDFTASRVNIVVPEVYDPMTDRNVALENARMAFPLYPQMEVVQTGPGKEDWQVCTLNGEINYGSIESELSVGYRDPEGQLGLGGARFGVGGGTPPFREGNMWCLDVIGAMKDPNRNLPAKNHWKLVDTAKELRPYCCPTAQLIEINEKGDTTSHKWFQISGQNAQGQQTGTVEVVEFFGGRPGVPNPSPKYRDVGTVLNPLSNTKAVLLPDGNVLIGHGRIGACTTAEGTPCTFDEREGHFFQMFDPRDVDRGSGKINTRRLAMTTVSRGLHGTATLMPDATVLLAGENREALVRADDPSFPLMSSYAGRLPAGDPDQGVPVGQIFYPPYLFKQGGAKATRPVIAKSPARIDYRGHFDIEVAGNANRIASVSLIRSDHNTHSLTAGDRYVKLAFSVKKSGVAGKENGRLRVVAPNLPAQAVPGVYALYVVDRDGVPSVGKQVRIFPETRGKTTAFR